MLKTKQAWESLCLILSPARHRWLWQYNRRSCLDNKLSFHRLPLFANVRAVHHDILNRPPASQVCTSLVWLNGTCLPSYSGCRSFNGRCCSKFPRPRQEPTDFSSGFRWFTLRGSDSRVGVTSAVARLDSCFPHGCAAVGLVKLSGWNAYNAQI